MANARAHTYCLALIIHSPQTPTPLRSSRRGARQCRGEAGPRAELSRSTFSLPQRPRYSCTQPWPRSEPPAPSQRRCSLRPLNRRRPGAPRRTRGASPEASERRGASCIPTCEHERLARTAATRGGTDYSWRRRKPLRIWTRTTPARSNELRTRSPLLSRVVGSGASWPQKALIRAQRRPVQRRQPPRVGHA